MQKPRVRPIIRTRAARDKGDTQRMTIHHPDLCQVRYEFLLKIVEEHNDDNYTHFIHLVVHTFYVYMFYMIFILQQNDIQPTNHERDDANLLPPPPVPPQRIFYSYLDIQNEIPEDQER